MEIIYIYSVYYNIFFAYFQGFYKICTKKGDMMAGNRSRNIIVGLALVGLCAGVVNGLLGAGGGIIIVFALSRLLPDVGRDTGEAFSTALCVMLPISALSCFIYSARGHVSLDGFGIFIIPAVVGGAVGGLLLQRLRVSLLKKLFATLTVISGMILIVR